MSAAKPCAGMAMAALLAGCAAAPVRNPAAVWMPSPNHDARWPQLVVLHDTEMRSTAGALLVLRTRNAHGRVSAHYLIGRDGTLYQLVDETRRAWHAGRSRWAGLADLNSASIGIELDNDGVAGYPPAQIDTLLRLLRDLSSRYGIPAHAVVGHADVAPARKRDPQAGFPWQRLAHAGFGLWPREGRVAAPPGFDPWLALRLIGYDLDDRAAAVRAYRRHYRGDEADMLDAEDAAILHDLQQQLLAPAAAPPR